MKGFHRMSKRIVRFGVFGFITQDLISYTVLVAGTIIYTGARQC